MAIHAEVHPRGDVGLLTLDRPAKAHAYDREHLLAIREGFSWLSEEVHVVLIRSTGERAFCGGADLGELNEAPPEAALDLLSQEVFTAIARSPVISVVAVQGPAIAGGFELALACDLRVVGTRARFRLPETSLGIIPSAGGSTRLTRLVGPSIAKQVILAGRELSADDAIAFGLACELAEDPAERALEIAQGLAARDDVALRLAKQIIDMSEDRTSLDAERVAEALLYARRKQQARSR